MKKIILPLVAASFAVATPAFAQSDTGRAEPFVGLQVGTHDLGTAGAADDSGIIYGIYGGVDVPVSGPVFVGVEGNYNYGSSAIDREYGIAARIGTEISPGTKLFVRGGYQEVDLDVRRFTGVANPPAGIDDTDGDYTVGAGADIGLGRNLGLRFAVDTISFDTVRATTGLTLRF